MNDKNLPPSSKTSTKQEPAPDVKKEPQGPAQQPPWGWIAACLMLVLVVAIFALVIVPQKPKPVLKDCIGETLKAKGKTTDDNTLGAAADVAAKGSVKIDSKSTTETTYRVVSDQVIITAINACRDAEMKQGGGQLTSKDVEVRYEGVVNVVRKIGQRTLPVSGVEVFVKQRKFRCENGTDGSGQCTIEMEGVRGEDKVTIVARPNEGIREVDTSVGDFARNGATIEIQPDYAPFIVAPEDCTSHQPLNGAEVVVEAPDALLWGKSCGASPPQDLTACRREIVRDREAAFKYDKTTLTRLDVIVRPTSGRPERYPVDLAQFTGTFTPIVPKTCGGTTAAARIARCPPEIEGALRSSALKANVRGAISTRVSKKGSVVAVSGPEEVQRQLYGKSFGPQHAGECLANFTL